MKFTEKEKQQLKQEFAKLVDSFSGHTEFVKILLEMAKIHSKKSQDYAQSDNPFANIELCERGGVPAWKGVIIRLGDKYSRLLNALAGKLFNFEGVEDAFLDNANYSIIGLIEYRKHQKQMEEKEI